MPPGPAKRLLQSVALHWKPTLPEQDAGIGGRDIARTQYRPPVQRHAVGALTSVDADHMGTAVSELLLDRPVHGNLAHHVMPIDTVHAPTPKPLFGKESR